MTRDPRVDPPAVNHHSQCPAHPDYEPAGVYPCACAQLDDDLRELAAELAYDQSREDR